MRKSIMFLILFFLLLPLSSVYTVELTVNGSRRPDLTPASYHPLSKIIHPHTKLPVQGVSLGEVVPLFADIWEANAETASGVVKLPSQGLAERLFSIFLVPSVRGTDLLVGDERYGDIRSLSFRGELLDRKELEVWIDWEGTRELKAEIARFAGFHDCSISVQEVPNIRSKVSTVIRGRGRPADLFMIQSDYLSEFVAARAVQALDYMDMTGLAEKGLDAFTLDRRRYAVPFYFDAQLLFYHCRHLLQSPPSSWRLQDFEVLCRELRTAGTVPAAWNAYSLYWLLPFQKAFGKESFIEKDGSVRIDDEPTREALQYILHLRDRALFEVMERDAMISAFTSGRVGMILSGSYSIPEFERIDLPFGTAVYPEPLAPLLDFKGFAISGRTGNPVLARRLIQYLTGIGVQQRFTSTLGKMPAALSAWAIAEGENPYFQVLSESYRRGITVPAEEGYINMKNIMWRLLRLAITGRMGVEEVLSTGQRLIDENIRN
jgi:ABC-type glycerol-3-phosphate transport system substrate-binding protein